MSKVKITMLIACFGTLIPAWIASALLDSIDTSLAFYNSGTGLTVLSLFALSFFGTSFGYIYNKKIGYGILSGLGKWMLICFGIWIYYATSNPDNPEHPYIIFIGIVLAFIWGAIDFGFLYHLAKNRNLDN